MPALKAFGRRWAVASDDFVFPALTELLFRTAWVAIVFSLIIVHSASGGLAGKCSLDTDLSIFYFATLALYLSFIVLCLFIAIVSARGSIMDERPRRLLPYLLYIRLAMFAPEIALNVFGSMWLFNPVVDSNTCDSFIVEAVPVAQAIIVVSWMMFLGSIILFLIIFDPLGREPISPASHGEFSNSSNAQVWERRCKWLCFCFAGSGADYGEIGRMLAEYFVDTDLVATDIAAGLALLAAQRQHDLDHKPHRPPYSLATVPKWMDLDNALHFIPYASAMYGWPFYLFHQGCGGCWRLCGSTFNNCCRTSAKKAPVFGDNCCRCNLAALRHISQLPFEDIVTLELRNKLYEVPFLVCADRQKRAIVVAIRGTLSLADAVTDMTAIAEPFAPNEIPGRNSDDMLNLYAHKGILLAARRVVKRLEENDVLQQAFSMYPECDEGVYIVGHSLGAGTAALVTLLLNNRRDLLGNRNLRCFAFAPPGGLVSRDTNASMADDLVCSVTLSGDLVPRLSLPNMLKLKADLIQALRRSRRPKYHIFGGVLCSKACCVRQEEVVDIEEGYVPVPVNDHQSLLPASSAPSDVSATAVVPTYRSIASEPKLFPPGRVLTIDEVKNANIADRYTATYCDPTECFRNIIISTDMIRHHFPYTLHDALAAGPKLTTDG